LIVISHFTHECNVCFCRFLIIGDLKNCTVSVKVFLRVPQHIANYALRRKDYIMKAEVNYQFRQRMSVVHKPNRFDSTKIPGDGQIEVTSQWCITYPGNADKVLMNAVRDLEDYFTVSMGLDLKVMREDGIGSHRIVYSVDPQLPSNAYRFKATAEQINLIGCNSRMAAQAGYFLEDLMNLCEAPYLDPADTVRTSLFNPRMVHSGYGLDMYPAEYLLNVAHSGISSLLVFVKDVDITPHGYQDFNDLCVRAAAYGLDVYAYSYLANKLHPDDEGAEEFYENLYGRLFDRCPYFRGLIFVGESCEFPSKDPNCTGMRRKDNRGPDGKPLITGKPHPGWWPCYDYTDWLNLIRKIVYKRKPDADIVLWSYNWGSKPDEARKALVDTLPKDIALQATFEMCETVERDGIQNRTTDYTLFFAGPGHYFKTESQFAKENGLRLYSMTNTGGLTWDIGVVPYIPAPYQWMKRYEGMVKAHYEVGLCGTMDSHHFGFYPSFISDLAKWAFYAPSTDLDDILHKLAARDFAPEYADDVCQAYKHFSDGIHHLISTNPNQYGPCRCGPAYPFVLFDNPDVQIPTVPYAHFGGNKICFPNYGMTVVGGVYEMNNLIATEEMLAKFNYEIENFKQTAALYDSGTRILEEIIPSIPARKQEDAQRILGLCKFIANTARTAVNMKEFYKCKVALTGAAGDAVKPLVEQIYAICQRERENVLATVPLVEFDSRLGYEPSMEYMCDAAHLQWKLSLLDALMNKELPELLKKNKISQ